MFNAASRRVTLFSGAALNFAFQSRPGSIPFAADTARINAPFFPLFVSLDPDGRIAQVAECAFIVLSVRRRGGVKQAGIPRTPSPAAIITCLLTCN